MLRALSGEIILLVPGLGWRRSPTFGEHIAATGRPHLDARDHGKSPYILSTGRRIRYRPLGLRSCVGLKALFDQPRMDKPCAGLQMLWLAFVIMGCALNDMHLPILSVSRRCRPIPGWLAGGTVIGAVFNDDQWN